MSTDATFSRLNFPELNTGAKNFSKVAYTELRSDDEAQERAFEQAKVRGHAAGYTAGMREGAEMMRERQLALEQDHAAMMADGRARVQQAVAALAAATRALEERAAPVLAAAQNTLAAAAMELAEAILGHELSDGDASARSALTRALAGVDASRVHTVRMNPADLTMLAPETRSHAGVNFSPDSSLAQGDAVTEFADGFLDARIGTALDRAKAALLEVRQ